MADFHIITLTHDDERFYHLMGPFLAQRAIVHEIGGALWDDVGKRWFIAQTSDGAVVGFAAVMRHWFCHAYVLPAWRNQGIYQALYEARMAAIRGLSEPLHVVANGNSASFYQRRGWHTVRQRGRFVELCWGEGAE